MTWARVLGAISVSGALAAAACGDSSASCEQSGDCSAPAATGGEPSTGSSNEGGEAGNGGGGGGESDACSAACGAAFEAEVACVESECAITRCESGFADCNEEYDDGCESSDTGLPGVPIAVAPMVGEYTGSAHAERSLTPTFRWLAPGETGSCDSLTYELELTTACKFGQIPNCSFEEAEIRETSLTETEWTPEAPLSVKLEPPVGSPYFWRVRACETKARCSDWSSVRYLNVGRLVDDVNGDGYSELLSVGSDTNEIHRGLFFVGGPTTPLTEASVLPSSIGTPNNGRFVGDLNGDGFQDVLVWNSSSTTEVPRVLLGSGSLGTLGTAAMPQPIRVSHSGSRAGDLDADGFAELVISEFDDTDQEDATGVVHVYRGAALLDLRSPLDLVPPAESDEAEFGVALEGGLDLDSDGFPDLAVLDGNEGLIHIARGGSPEGLSFETTLESAALVNAGSAPDTPPRLLAAGDMNGDGYEDLAAYVFNSVTDADNSVVMVFPGGDPLLGEAIWNVTLDSNAGLCWSGGADFGEDGFADLLILYGAEVEAAPFTASVRFLPGGTDEALSPLQVGDFGAAASNLSQVVSGDYDGDGHRDLVMGSATSSLAERKWLSGGAAMTESQNCSQPDSSFSRVGNWCTAKTFTATAASPLENYLGVFVR